MVKIFETDKAIELGADDATTILASDIVVSEWVRLKCQYGCPGYAKCLTCPPYSPTPEVTRRLIKDYSYAILVYVRTAGTLEELKARHKLQRVVTDLERNLILSGNYKAFGLTAGHCTFCPVCDFEKPCVVPERARPSAEACGIDLFATARNAGWRCEMLTSRDDDFHQLGLILVD